MLALAAACSSSNPRFGADDFERREDTNGVPTYMASGSIGYGEDAERAAGKVIMAACPKGGPQLLSGQAMSFNGQDRYGYPSSGTYWFAVFTCDDVIALD